LDVEVLHCDRLGFAGEAEGQLALEVGTGGGDLGVLTGDDLGLPFPVL